MRVRILTAAVLSAIAGSASVAAGPAGKPELNKSGVKAVVAWGGHSAEITFGGPGKPAIGVFDGATQFELDPARAANLQAQFDSARVVDLPTKVGGIPGRSGRIGPNDPPPLVGWVTVRDGGDAIANVNQLGGGHQSKELARFAAEVLGACESSAKAGARAADLSDGLAKLRAGAVGPNGLSVMYTSAAPADWGDSNGIGLTIEDSVVTARKWDGYRWGPALRVTFTAEEIGTLTKSLADKGLAGIPDETGAAVPTELIVKVLGSRKHIRASSETYQNEMDRLVQRIQAKRAGLAAGVGEDPLANFRGVQEVLSQVFHRVMMEGKPVAE